MEHISCLSTSELMPVMAEYTCEWGLDSEMRLSEKSYGY